MYFLRMCTCPGLPTDVQWYCFGNGSAHSISFCTENCPKQSTFMMNGQTVVAPKCPTCYTLSSLSIPSHCTMGWNGQTRIHTKVYVPLATPCPHCPSHPTVPWDGMDRLGYILKCPICYTLPPVSIPSHCTMGWNGQIGTVQDFAESLQHATT